MFLALNAAVVVALYANQQQLAESQILWVPFRPHQLGTFAVAWLAPRLWVGATTIAAFVITALVQSARFDAAIQARLPFGSDYATLMFGLFALVLLFYRRRADKIQRDVVRAQTEAASYERFARAMLAIRDLSNTPLQTLGNVAALLRRRVPELDGTVDCLERSVARLQQLEQATRPFERYLTWHPGDESWDPKDFLETSATRRPEPVPE